MRYFIMGRSMGTVRILRGLRLALGGAILGSAIAGLLSPHVAAPPEHVSAVGAVGGFLVVAAIKVAHLI